MTAAAATITVTFSNPAAATAANAHLSAEVDSRPAGLNAGKSNFIPGTSAYVLIYKTANVSLLPAETSAGSFSYGGTESILQTEQIQFANVTTATLKVPADGELVSYKWIGRDLGIPVIGADAQTIIIPNAGMGLLQIIYNSTAVIGALAAPESVSGEVDFSVLVLIKGEVIP